MRNSTGKQAANAIIRDLSDRRGLRHEWDRIDREIQVEIRKKWAALIDAAVSKAKEGAQDVGK